MAQGFYIRRGELIEHILASDQISDTTKCIGVTLLQKYMNSQNEMAWMSASTLALCCSRRSETVSRALKSLVKLGFLDREMRTGRTTVYQMGAPWQARATPDRRITNP